MQFLEIIYFVIPSYSLVVQIIIISEICWLFESYIVAPVMPKVRRSRKPPPEGWELIEPTLEVSRVDTLCRP